MYGGEHPYSTQDTVWFSYYRITDDDPFGIDNYVNEFVARIGRKMEGSSSSASS